jgi:hypothetical protein
MSWVIVKAEAGRFLLLAGKCETESGGGVHSDPGSLWAAVFDVTARWHHGRWVWAFLHQQQQHCHWSSCRQQHCSQWEASPWHSSCCSCLIIISTQSFTTPNPCCGSSSSSSFQFQCCQQIHLLPSSTTVAINQIPLETDQETGIFWHPLEKVEVIPPSTTSSDHQHKRKTCWR